MKDEDLVKMLTSRDYRITQSDFWAIRRQEECEGAFYVGRASFSAELPEAYIDYELPLRIPRFCDSSLDLKVRLACYLTSSGEFGNFNTFGTTALLEEQQIDWHAVSAMFPRTARKAWRIAQRRMYRELVRFSANKPACNKCGLPLSLLCWHHRRDLSELANVK
jgi:hypothetical protein